MKLKWLIVFISLVLLQTLTVSLEAVTIKIATIAPTRSPWVTELKKLNLEWSKITNGTVTIKIYAGGVMGDEEDVVRKIRMGLLGGGVFTNVGMTNINPETSIFNIPFYLNSEQELDYLMVKMRPTFEKQIEDKGFKVIAWAKAGWIYFFTKDPIYYPDDLKKHKISFSTGYTDWENAWKKSGYHVVPSELKDLMMALQSGMVDSFYLSPIVAASSQYFPLSPNMCPLKIAPLMGGMVLSKKIWDTIPDQYKKELMTVSEQMAERLYLESIKLEEEAITEMKKHGLKITAVPDDAREKWKIAADKGMDALIGKAFSKDIFAQFLQHLNDYRQSKPETAHSGNK